MENNRNSLEKYSYEDFVNAANLWQGESVKYHWMLVALETGFYSIESVPCIAMGDSEGFFTYEEIKEIGKAFKEMDNPSIPRKTTEIRGAEYLILAQALTPERMVEYLNLKYGTSSTK